MNEKEKMIEKIEGITKKIDELDSDSFSNQETYKQVLDSYIKERDLLTKELFSMMKYKGE
jgi:hypothetical protein